MEKYVAVIQDKEYFIGMKRLKDRSIPPSKKFFATAQYVAEKAVRDSGIKTNRENPVPLTVKVYKLVIDLGKSSQTERLFIKDFSIIPPLEGMTDNVKNLPNEELAKLFIIVNNHLSSGDYVKRINTEYHLRKALGEM